MQSTMGALSTNLLWIRDCRLSLTVFPGADIGASARVQICRGIKRKGDVALIESSMALDLHCSCVGQP